MFGLFAGEVAAGVEGVDADVVEGAAAGEFFGETPLLGRDVESEGGFDGLDFAEGAVSDDLDGAKVGGLVVAAVGDHELDVGGLAGGDHGFRIGDGGGHGLFAHHVLAGFGGADGVFGVHGVRQGDVDGIDGGVVGDVVEVFIVVDGGGRDVVLRSDAGGFFGVTADEGGDAGVGGEQGAGEEVGGDLAEADYGVADLAIWIRGGGRGGVLGTQDWGETGGEREGGEPGEFAAGEVGHGRRPLVASRARIADSHGLLDADVGVDVDDEVFALDLDGVDLEAVEGDFVAGGGGGAGEGLAEEVGGIDLHAGGDLVGKKRLEDEVELLVAADAVYAGVTEADGLAIALRGKGDFGGEGEGDADAGGAHFLA